ncbi:MAG: metallophosphoesterase [Candidatus Omnitrophica bacterium]|nr:metallophosphoesterase [Candidatus Omnitrophota bacterium]
MKKIVHMSDIHVGFSDYDLRFKRIAERLIENKAVQGADCVIVITGDIVEDANNPDNYKRAKATLDVLKENSFKNILLVPGNHDYGTGSRGDKKFVRIFKKVFYDENFEFPKKDIIDGIAFIGLDSMAEELNWYDKLFAEGELGEKQLLVLSELLLDDRDVRSCRKRVIYLHHHPFKFRPLHQLKDANKLKKVLTRAMHKGISIDALLFGHNHEGNAHNNVWGIPRCYDAGSATLKPRPKILKGTVWFQIKASVRMIDLENDDTAQDRVLTLL